MDIIKNHLFSLILGVIALVALTTPFWLLSGYASMLETKAKASQSTASTITGLLNKERMTPGVSIDGQATPLDRFPNQATIDEGRALQQKVAASAADMVKAATEINQQSMTLPGLSDVLLVKDALPSPRNNGAFDFRNRYKELAAQQTLARQLLQGDTPPTREEVSDAINTLKSQIERKFRTYPNGGDNREELTKEYETQSVLIAPRLLNDRASAIRMYVDSQAFTWHPAFAQIGGERPTRRRSGRHSSVCGCRPALPAFSPRPTVRHTTFAMPSSNGWCGLILPKTRMSWPSRPSRRIRA